jgi:D-aspartate ligase
MVRKNESSLTENSVPVVILDTDHYGAIGIARTLGRLGIPIHFFDSNPKSISFHSRFCKSAFNYRKNQDSKLTVRLLLQAAKIIGEKSILITTTDESALLLAEHFSELKKNFIYHQLSPTLVKALTSKREMFYLAKNYGIPTAETYFPKSREDVKQFLKKSSFPIMLKAIDGKASLLKTGHKMFLAKTEQELLNLYDRYETPYNANYMLQEYIPGGEDSIWMFNGYFNSKSECLFGVTGKKIRQSPVYTGATSLGICLRNNIIQKMTEDLAKKVGYKGIIDIGYRYDERDGKYKVLDINPRIGQTFRLFVAATKMDVARAAYLDLTGQKVPSSIVFEGRKWIVEDKDLISSLRYIHDKNLTVRNWMASFRGVQESAWFALDDPVPFFLMCKQFIVRSTEHLLKLSANENNQPFWDHFGTTP